MRNASVRAAIAAGLLGIAWANGGYVRTLAGLALFSVLLRTGPDGQSVIEHIAGWTAARARGM